MLLKNFCGRFGTCFKSINILNSNTCWIPNLITAGVALAYTSGLECLAQTGVAFDSVNVYPGKTTTILIYTAQLFLEEFLWLRFARGLGSTYTSVRT